MYLMNSALKSSILSFEMVSPAAALCPPYLSRSGAHATSPSRMLHDLTPRAEPLPTSPSMAMMTTGRENLSTRREATMPITPGCQPSQESTMALPVSEPASMSSACLSVSASIFWRDAFSLPSLAASSTASFASSLTSSRRATEAQATRPAAFILGAIWKAMFSAVTLPGLRSTEFLSARSPGRRVFSSSFSPKLTSTLFSSTRGTMSATVPMATRSR